MKYRWGFLDENDNFTECDPKVDNATAIDYARESNELFYRAKLNGSLAFRFEFDDIIAQGYNAEHRIVLQSFDNDLNDWCEVWRGRFALTDCEIDFDTNTITVTPQTLDRYTNILDHIEDEYNLIKLAPEQLPVDILIRPLVQIYEVRDIKISNYIGNNYWEKDCDSVGRNDIDTYKFGLQKQYISVLIQYTDQVNPDFPYRAGKNILYVGEVIYGGLPQESTRVYGQYWDGASWQTDTLRVRVAQYTNTTEFQFYSDPDQPGSQQTPMVTAEYEAYGMGTIANITIGLPLMVDDAYSQWDMICARILVQTDLDSVEIHGQTYTLDDIPNNDMAGSNLNYNKVFYADMIEIKVSNEVQSEPTQWGCNYKDEYFVKPTDVGFSRWMPVGQSLWKYFSIWWRIDATSVMTIINEQLTAEQTIKDSYPVINVVSKLLEKQGWNGNIISGCFGAENYVGAQMFPVITPKSNVISSYYNTPAQNAKITFAKILNMLKQAFKVYWYLDNNNDLHFEHVSFFDNGFSYTEGEPALLVDLDTTLHTNTKSVKDYGQNKIKFDKSDMPGSYEFGWMDAQTRPFDGWPIKCLDNYVSKGLIEEKIIGDFSTDVDFILSSPNDVSKDGFVLFALPYIEGAYSTKLVVDRFLITDETGASFYVELQNADAAFVRIHRSWWRYQLPCENVNINNEDTNAITTGNFKSQAVEFADTAMAEVLKDVDNANKIIRTQQGDGHVKTISVNLNSLKTSGDLLFNFVGRWFYLRGAALGNSIIINFNGESITISVDDNRFTYRYKEPISVLKFNAADVVSVNFADVDKLDNLTSADEMFDGCEELLAVDFGGKTFGAVTSANNMFRGCVALTTLICPDSSTWKADLDFSDCPDLTLESFYDLLKFLYYYGAGVHTITPNTTFWNALDADTQNDLLTKASARGWTIGIPAQYSISGQSAANTVYATINGSSVEIPVTGGLFQYDYNAPITSISFENDADVTDIDFSLSDGLAGVTSLNDVFKNCAGLTTVDFTNCDLSNVASASDAFAGCIALYELIIPQDTWQPDVDLSDGVMPKAEMLNVINGLYDYTSGTHTITFNQTIWDAMSVADQQIVFDAADAKGWTTNAVAVVYHIKGTATTANVTIHIDGADVVVDVVNSAFDYQYQTPITQLAFGDTTETTHDEFITIDLSEADDFTSLLNCANFLRGCRQLTRIDAPQTFENVTTAERFFWICGNALEINMPNATFANASLSNFVGALYPKDKIFSLPSFIGGFLGSMTAPFIQNCQNMDVVNLPNATFANLTTCNNLIITTPLKELLLPSATFASVTNAASMLDSVNNNLRKLEKLNMASATFASCTNCSRMFYYVGYQSADHSQLEINMPNATFANVTNAQYMFGAFGGVKINMPNATFGTYGNFQYFANEMAHCAEINFASFTAQYATTLDRWFNQDSALQTLILPNSALCNVAVPLPSSPLSYQSMLNVANWVKDRTGQSALTITFKATAWNALSSAEQNTIDGILSGKNWNRAIA